MRRDQTYTIDRKGYICVVGTAIRRIEAGMEVEVQLVKKNEKIRGIFDL